MALTSSSAASSSCGSTSTCDKWAIEPLKKGGAGVVIGKLFCNFIIGWLLDLMNMLQLDALRETSQTDSYPDRRPFRVCHLYSFIRHLGLKWAAVDHFQHRLSNEPSWSWASARWIDGKKWVANVCNNDQQCLEKCDEFSVDYSHPRCTWITSFCPAQEELLNFHFRDKTATGQSLNETYKLCYFFFT